jgi:CelD/BcsL family acetyltransferase involved in cellulose biosynthesis
MRPNSSITVPSMAEVVEVNDLEQLASYQLAWNALFQQTPKASFFHTYQWFVTYWKHFGGDRRMRVLVVRSGDTTIGIVPLCVIKEQHRLSEIRVLTYPLSDWGMWYGPIGANQSTTMFMALQHLRETPRDWDMMDLRWVSGNASELDVTGRAMAAAGWRTQRSLYQQTSLIEFEGTDWNTYFTTLPKKWRHEIRRQERNLEKRGAVEFERHRPESLSAGDGEPRWDLFEECLEVSRRSWQSQAEDGNTLCHAEVLPFIRACHAQAAQLGMLDMAVLRVGGEAVAYQYNYHHQGEVFGLRMGYAREARDWGVGKILLARFLEDSFSRGDRVLDLGVGDFDFKVKFRTGIAASFRHSYYPWNAWRSQSVRLSQWLKQQFVKEEPPIKSAIA